MKRKPNETKVWIRTPFMPFGQETNHANSTAPGAHMGLDKQGSV